MLLPCPMPCDSSRQGARPPSLARLHRDEATAAERIDISRALLPLSTLAGWVSAAIAARPLGSRPA